MTAYNVDKITKIEVCDFKETKLQPDRTEIDPRIYNIRDWVVCVNPRVTFYFDSGNSEFHYFKTLEAAVEALRHMTSSGNWITI